MIPVYIILLSAELLFKCFSSFLGNFGMLTILQAIIGTVLLCKEGRFYFKRLNSFLDLRWEVKLTNE